MEEAVDRQQEVAECQKVLAGLSPRDRQVLMLRFSGFSYAEMAEALQVEKGSVGTILARAMARFKQEYHKNLSVAERPGGEVRCVLT